MGPSNIVYGGGWGKARGCPPALARGSLGERTSKGEGSDRGKSGGGPRSPGNYNEGAVDGGHVYRSGETVRLGKEKVKT